jgi:aspartyl-tRNA(Asn)/glutamyl-tRNA(Gln) amidotransferase subunit A
MGLKRHSTIAELRRKLDAGETSSSQLTQACFDRIAEAGDQGKRTFTRLYQDTALAAARVQDELLGAGVRLSPMAGIPLSIKDLFDIEGEETLSGSSLPNPAGRAERDALVIQRLRMAGAVLVGRTNMSEYAYSGVGRNLHHGTPGNPYDRSRIPGGSSSGAAVSVGEGMVPAAIGSDTGGSVRIPAALCGLVGFKPTQRRIPLDGARPLSWSLDSIGPLAESVDCCYVLDAIMAGERVGPLDAAAVRGLRLGVPDRIVLDNLDPEVGKDFDRALATLSRAGVQIVDLHVPEIAEVVNLGSVSRIIGAESHTILRSQLEDINAITDRVISSRITAGGTISAADYLTVMRARDVLIERAVATLAAVDAIVMPTVPILAPTINAVQEDAGFHRVNKLVLRNTSIGNFLNLCAITLPLPQPASLPTGFMLMAAGGADRRLLSVAKGIESLFAQQG